MSPRRSNYDNEYDRPSAPPPLDDMSTEFYGRGADDNEETKIPGRRPANRSAEEDDVTRVGFDSSSRYDETVLDDAFIRPKNAVEAILWVKEGSRRGKWYPIYNGAIIGRDEGNVILDDPKVSGSHAKITFENGQYFIWDFGSSNGTYVKGRRIREATPLEENDRVKIGDTVFLVKLLDARKKPAKKTTANRKSTASKSKSRSAAASTRRKATTTKK